MILKNKVSIVTGGSRGIGRAITSLLVEHGSEVVICGRNVDDLIKTTQLLNKKNNLCSFVKADISNERDVKNLAEKVLSKYKRADFLVNNAGIGVYKPFTESTIEDWNTTIGTNLTGIYLCSRAFIKIMIKQKSGYILNIASKAGKIGIENLTLYCASKSGVIGLTKAMKKDLKNTGVRVSYICPSFVKTNFFKNFPKNFYLPPSAADPEKIAKQAVNLLTNKNKMLNKLKEFLKLN